MTRGKRPVLPFAMACLLLAACGELRLPRAPSTVGQTPRFDVGNAIALSVLADTIYLIDPTSGTVRTLVSGLSDFQAGYAAWSPDHATIAFGNAGIHLQDVSTGHDQTLVKGQSISMPAWSGDGARLVYGDGMHLWVSPVSGATPLELSVPETLAPLEMAWRPGRAILFNGLVLDCAQAGGCASTEASDIWSIKPDGSGLRQLTHLGHASSPKWSPDHSQFLFVRRTTGAHPRSELWVARANGSSPRRLLADADVVAADWSPDGGQIAVVRQGPQPETLQLWVTDADGTAARSVGEPVAGADATVDW
jgi:Tol biopolymer transport system component